MRNLQMRNISTLLVPFALLIGGSGCVTSGGAPVTKQPARDLDIAQAPAGAEQLPVIGATNEAAAAVDWRQYFQRPPTQQERSELARRVERWSDSKSPSEVLARARGQIALGKVNEGEASLREALRLQPVNDEAWLDLAGVYARTRDASRLFEVLGEINDSIADKAAANPVQVMRYRFLLAQGYFLTGRGGEARTILSDMIVRYPDFTPAYVALADSYLREGRPQIAEFVVKRAMDRGKDDASLENLMGAVAFSRKDFKAAAGHFSRAIEMAPTYGQALVNRANIAIRENEMSAAEEDLNRAIAIDPANPDALIARGVVYRRTGRAELARAAFERVLEVDPVNASARFNLGVLNALDLNRPEVAVRLFEEVASMVHAPKSIRASAEGYLGDLKSMM
ncbi:MAG: hypothetical protein RIQ81_2088 [Pseudomonadota bacterium]|jgi:Flp pilus assembly protein TadD